MTTKARVIFTRTSARIAAAQTCSGGITVFEILGHEQVSRGDILSGTMELPREQDIYNETLDEKLKVLVHECGMDLQAAVEKYFAKVSCVISGK